MMGLFRVLYDELALDGFFSAVARSMFALRRSREQMFIERTLPLLLLLRPSAVFLLAHTAYSVSLVARLTDGDEYRGLRTERGEASLSNNPKACTIWR